VSPIKSANFSVNFPSPHPKSSIFKFCAFIILLNCVARISCNLDSGVQSCSFLVSVVLAIVVEGVRNHVHYIVRYRSSFHFLGVALTDPRMGGGGGGSVLRL